MMPQWISDLITVAPWLGAFFVAAFFGIKLWRCVAPVFRMFREFLEDWKGEPDRPGVKGRAGVMARLGSIEHELHPNSGLSMRDAINRTEKQGKDMGEKLDAHMASCPAPQTTTINVNPGGTQ